MEYSSSLIRTDHIHSFLSTEKRIYVQWNVSTILLQKNYMVIIGNFCLMCLLFNIVSSIQIGIMLTYKSYCWQQSCGVERVKVSICILKCAFNRRNNPCQVILPFGKPGFLIFKTVLSLPHMVALRAK